MNQFYRLLTGGGLEGVHHPLFLGCIPKLTIPKARFPLLHNPAGQLESYNKGAGHLLPLVVFWILDMPPRWPRKPDRNDPAYRRLDDRMNFAVHVAVFAALNSGTWFVRTVQAQQWAWVPWFTLSWLTVLGLHFVYIVAIADYSNPAIPSSSEKPS